MPDWLAAIIFGFVQGVAEFLPISSSGHLVLLHYFFPLPVANDLAFDAVLHLAALCALVWYFFSDWKNLFFAWLKSWSGQHSDSSRLAWIIILATFPAALAGYWLEAYFEQIRQPAVVAFSLAAVGGLLIVVEKIRPGGREINATRWSDGLYIGLAQAIALIPGVSRSGITMVAGLSRGLSRIAAVRFSFLLAAPIIAGAGLKALKGLILFPSGRAEFFLLAVAFFTAWLSSFFAIKFLLYYVRQSTLIPFAVYRLCLALLILLIWIVRD